MITLESGRPEAIPLAIVITSGVTSKCPTAKNLPVRPMPDLNLIGDQQDAGLIAQRAQRPQKRTGGTT